MRSWHFKLRTSIFLKLFIVLLISGAVIIFAFMAGFRFAMRPHFESRIELNVRNYIRYLVADLGTPPKFEKGKTLADSLGLRMRIEGNGWSWSTSDDVPEISSFPDRGSRQERLKRRSLIPGLLMLKPEDSGPHEIIDYEFADGPGKVLVMGPHRVMEPDYSFIFSLVGFVIFVLLCSYVSIRWILSPIRTLTQGVGVIATGNLEYQVPIHSTDELGKLGNAFNAMVVRVKEMLHSKQQLLVDVSHELRSPLTRAKIGVELIDETDTTKQITSDLNELEVMIEGLLESARLDSGHTELTMESADAVSLTKDVVRLYTNLGKPVQIVDSPASIVGLIDGERFKSVVRNLIDNALKYSRDGKGVKVSLFQSETQFRLTVQDEGIGIPASEVSRVFEPFYRVDKSRTRKTGGFGLGLSLCKKIVEAHGGTINLKSELGAGTMVTVTFPLRLS